MAYLLSLDGLLAAQSLSPPPYPEQGLAEADLDLQRHRRWSLQFRLHHPRRSLPGAAPRPACQRCLWRLAASEATAAHPHCKTGWEQGLPRAAIRAGSRSRACARRKTYPCGVRNRESLEGCPTVRSAATIQVSQRPQQSRCLPGSLDAAPIPSLAASQGSRSPTGPTGTTPGSRVQTIRDAPRPAPPARPPPPPP